MKLLFKTSLILAALVWVTHTYAIEVDVSTPAKSTGIGFTVNGKKHGGLGSSYSGKNMPVGKYQFGLRINSKDVPCLIDGKKRVQVSENTKVVLDYKNSECSASIQ